MIDYIIIIWLGAITVYLVLSKTTFKLEGRVKVPKPPKPYICPHGKISTLTQYTVKGQKRTLCRYCYHKEEEQALIDNGKEVSENVLKYDLPRL